MKVCFVIPTDLFAQEHYNAPFLRALKKINLLKKSGHKIYVISWLRYKRDYPEFEVRDDLEIYRFYLFPPKKNLLKRIKFYFHLTKNISKKIIELKPDVIVCHDVELLYVCVKAKKKLNATLFYDSQEYFPAVFSEHNKIEAFLADFIERRFGKHANHIFTVSDGIAEKYRKKNFPVTTIYNSRPIFPLKEEQNYLKFKKSLGFSEKDFIVGFVGAIRTERGVETLIEILKELEENIKLLIIGGPESEMNRFKAHSKEYGVENRVVFTGALDGGIVLDYVSVFDVGTVIIPPLTLNYIFNAPNKLFDYMGVGIPIIASNFPDMKRIVEEEPKCGITLDPTKKNEIKDAILYFYNNREECKKMGVNARKKFIERYCWERQEEKMRNAHTIWKHNNICG